MMVQSTEKSLWRISFEETLDIPHSPASFTRASTRVLIEALGVREPASRLDGPNDLVAPCDGRWAQRKGASVGVQRAHRMLERCPRTVRLNRWSCHPGILPHGCFEWAGQCFPLGSLPRPTRASKDQR